MSKLTITPRKAADINTIAPATNFALSLFLGILSLCCILPLLLVFIVSFTPEHVLLRNGYSFFPQEVTTFAYRYLFTQPDAIIRGYLITIFVTVVGTTLHLLFCGMIAYTLSRKNCRYRGFINFLVFFPMLFSGGLVPWYITWTQGLGMKNNIFILILPYVVTSMHVLVMRTFFSTTIPESLVEAAKIDGAEELRIFFRLVIPLAKPVFATIGLLTSLMYWNDWYLNLIFISDEKLSNLQFLMQRVMMNIEFLSRNSQATNNDPTVIASLPQETVRMAMAILGIGPIILIYPFFQKYIVRGLTIGAIKG